MKVYGSPNSRSTRVLWALEESEATYEFVPLALKKGEGRQASYLAMNPGGKVPSIQDGELFLTESAAICTYIGECYLDSGLVPSSRIERARYHQWCYFIMTEFEQPLWTLSKHRFALPKKWHVPDIFRTAKWEFSVAASILSKGLGKKEFLVGDRFTAADILAAHALLWATVAKCPIEHENLARYKEKMLSRPALVRALEREKKASEVIA